MTWFESVNLAVAGWMAAFAGLIGFLVLLSTTWHNWRVRRMLETQVEQQAVMIEQLEGVLRRLPLEERVLADAPPAPSVENQVARLAHGPAWESLKDTVGR